MFEQEKNVGSPTWQRIVRTNPLRQLSSARIYFRYDFFHLRQRNVFCRRAISAQTPFGWGAREMCSKVKLPGIVEWLREFFLMA